MPAANPDHPTSLASLRQRIPLFVLIGVFIACDIAIATVVDARDEVAAGILLGVVFAQITLIAVWTAFGIRSAFSRMVCGAVLVMLLGLVLVACINNSGASDGQWLWFLIVVSLWFAIQASLWVVRLVFGWRLALANQLAGETDRSELQFDIRQLLVWTALVAITLGIGRSLLPEDSIGAVPRKNTIVVYCVLTSFTCLLAWPVVWASLARRRVLFWLIVAACCCVVLTIAEISTFQAATGRRNDDDSATFWIMNSLQAFAACGGLLVFRASGFRLVRGASLDPLHRSETVED